MKGMWDCIEQCKERVKYLYLCEHCVTYSAMVIAYSLNFCNSLQNV